MTPEEQQARRKRLRKISAQLEMFPTCREIRQFRVNRPWNLWCDVADDKVWDIVTSDPDTYETRTLYTRSE